MDTKRIEQLAERRGRPFKVLIVDDEPRVREVFKEFCEATKSVEVDLAENGVEAVEKVKNTEYDLVTMDLIMPEMSGVEAVTRIKETKPHLPVIVITGNARIKRSFCSRFIGILLFRSVLTGTPHRVTGHGYHWPGQSPAVPTGIRSCR